MFSDKYQFKLVVYLLVIQTFVHHGVMFKKDGIKAVFNQKTKPSNHSTKESKRIIKKITGYFLPPQTGEYKFFSSCSESCEISLSDNVERLRKQRIISQKEPTHPNAYERYADQASHLIYLQKNKVYFIQASSTSTHPDVASHLSVGVILPDDKKLFPISYPYLKNVMVEKIPVRTTILRDTTGTSRGHVMSKPKFLAKSSDGTEIHKTPKLKAKSKSNQRLLRKLEQIGEFIKDLEKTKNEETKFDVNFDDVMRSLQKSVKKYVPKARKSEETGAGINQSWKVNHEYNSALKSDHHRKTKTTTGVDRSFKHPDELKREHTPRYIPKSLKNQSSVKRQLFDLVDLLQKRFSHGNSKHSKKHSKQSKYTENFEDLMGEINALKRELTSRPGPHKSHRRSNKKKFHHKDKLDERNDMDESSGETFSGDDDIKKLKLSDKDRIVIKEVNSHGESSLDDEKPTLSKHAEKQKKGSEQRKHDKEEFFGKNNDDEQQDKLSRKEGHLDKERKHSERIEQYENNAFSTIPYKSREQDKTSEPTVNFHSKQDISSSSSYQGNHDAGNVASIIPNENLVNGDQKENIEPAEKHTGNDGQLQSVVAQHPIDNIVSVSDHSPPEKPTTQTPFSGHMPSEQSTIHTDVSDHSLSEQSTINTDVSDHSLSEQSSTHGDETARDDTKSFNIQQHTLRKEDEENNKQVSNLHDTLRTAGILSSDDSLYRYRTVDSFAGKHEPVATDDATLRLASDRTNSNFENHNEQVPVSDGMLSSDGNKVGIQSNENDLANPVVQDASVLPHKDEKIDKEDIKTLEDTLFHAFQDRLKSGSIKTTDKSNIIQSYPISGFVKSQVDSDNIQPRIEKEEKEVSNAANVDKETLQKVLENAISGNLHPQTEEQSEAREKVMDVRENEKLKERLQESIENAITRSTSDFNNNYILKSNENENQVTKPMQREETSPFVQDIESAITNALQKYQNPTNTVTKKIAGSTLAEDDIKILTSSLQKYKSPARHAGLDSLDMKVALEPTISLMSEHARIIPDVKEIQTHQNELREKENSKLIPAIQSADEQVYLGKIRELMDEIDAIKKEIVAMKRNKVFGSSYKKSLVAKLNSKEKLLTKLTAKKSVVNRPNKKSRIQRTRKTKMRRRCNKKCV